MASILRLLSEVQFSHVALDLLSLPQLTDQFFLSTRKLLVEGKTVVVISHEEDLVIPPACVVHHRIV